jgi:Sec-independent protein secretion pathway component TatC
MQFIRQIISPNEALPRATLAISMIVIFGLAVLFARIKISRQLEQLKPFALRLVRW